MGLFAVVFKHAFATEDFGEADGVVYRGMDTVDAVLKYLDNTFIPAWDEFGDYDKDGYAEEEIEIINLETMKSEGRWKLTIHTDEGYNFTSNMYKLKEEE